MPNLIGVISIVANLEMTVKSCVQIKQQRIGGVFSSAWQALKGDGEGGIWARERERNGTPARTPLFSLFFTLRF